MARAPRAKAPALIEMVDPPVKLRKGGLNKEFDLIGRDLKSEELEIGYVVVLLISDENGNVSKHQVYGVNLDVQTVSDNYVTILAKANDDFGGIYIGQNLHVALKVGGTIGSSVGTLIVTN